VMFCASLVGFAVRLLRVASGQSGAVAAVGLLGVALLMGFTSQASLHPGPLGFAFWSLTALLPRLSREAVRVPVDEQQRLRSSTMIGLRNA
jgi:hypothetical protein